MSYRRDMEVNHSAGRGNGGRDNSKLPSMHFRTREQGLWLPHCFWDVLWVAYIQMTPTGWIPSGITPSCVRLLGWILDTIWLTPLNINIKDFIQRLTQPSHLTLEEISTWKFALKYNDILDRFTDALLGGPCLYTLLASQWVCISSGHLRQVPPNSSWP